MAKICFYPWNIVGLTNRPWYHSYRELPVLCVFITYWYILLRAKFKILPLCFFYAKWMEKKTWPLYLYMIVAYPCFNKLRIFFFTVYTWLYILSKLFSFSKCPIPENVTMVFRASLKIQFNSLHCSTHSFPLVLLFTLFSSHMTRWFLYPCFHSCSVTLLECSLNKLEFRISVTVSSGLCDSSSLTFCYNWFMCMLCLPWGGQWKADKLCVRCPRFPP